IAPSSMEVMLISSKKSGLAVRHKPCKIKVRHPPSFHIPGNGEIKYLLNHGGNGTLPFYSPAPGGIVYVSPMKGFYLMKDFFCPVRKIMSEPICKDRLNRTV